MWTNKFNLFYLFMKANVDENQSDDNLYTFIQTQKKEKLILTFNKPLDLNVILEHNVYFEIKFNKNLDHTA